ncbi:hypothetical protein [Massilia scottii]|uniref:hypothetical protein n=1 Tax=Massilia scottii TaxID=3057166 RepID=UPI0027966D84|nr:hypothetical protein [Massilia sp. CCM 9029]MDQ1834166.1 hypothetical protein [Massilia sp. CCM 9029]
MQTQWQKIGGVAAFFEAFAYIVGFSVMLTMLQPAGGASATPEQQLGHILSMSALFKAWNIVIYVVFGAVLAVLVIALHARLASGAEMLMRVASAFGLIWSGLVIATGMIANVGLSTVAKLYIEDPRSATVAWRTLNAVQDGLGGGVELVGGLWVIVVSVVALRLAALPRSLNYVGICHRHGWCAHPDPAPWRTGRGFRHRSDCLVCLARDCVDIASGGHWSGA